jgi:hypothetical protein
MRAVSLPSLQKEWKSQGADLLITIITPFYKKEQARGFDTLAWG